VDYVTHTLFGFALYGAWNKRAMDAKTKWALLGAAVGSSVIPDIDIQWARAGADYLMSHRGITHSFAMVPVWAAMFSGLAWAIFRAKDRRIFFAALTGVLIHIVSDWTNGWGTGLFEPFTQRRYSAGFIPNKGYVFWAIAALLVPLLLLFRSETRRRAVFRAFWAIGACYAAFQLVHSASVYADLTRDGYAQVAIRADRLPGGLSYYAAKDGVVVEGRHELAGKRGVVRSYPNERVDFDRLQAYRPARNLLLFAPFVVAQRTEDGVRIFDPRFSGRIPFLSVEVPAEFVKAESGSTG